MVVPWMDHKVEYLSIREEVNVAMQQVIEGSVYMLNDDVTKGLHAPSLLRG